MKPLSYGIYGAHSKSHFEVKINIFEPYIRSGVTGLSLACQFDAVLPRACQKQLIRDFLFTRVHPIEKVTVWAVPF